MPRSDHLNLKQELAAAALEGAAAAVNQRLAATYTVEWFDLGPLHRQARVRTRDVDPYRLGLPAPRYFTIQVKESL
jgi:hypothetical protein